MRLHGAEKPHMPQPLPGDVHVNVPLTNISIAHVQDARAWIAPIVFPIVPSTKQSARYFVFDKGDMLRPQSKKRAPGTPSAGGGYKVDNTPTFFCDPDAFHKDVDDPTRANTDDPLSPDRDATVFVTQQLLMRREVDFNSKFLTTGKWGTDKTGVASAPGANQFLQWNDPSSDPVKDITDGIIAILKASGKQANRLVIGAEAWQAVRNHPAVLERIKYTQRATATPDLFASLVALDLRSNGLIGDFQVLVATAIQNTAAEGQTASTSFIVGKVALLCYAAPAPSLMEPSGGYIFTWTGYLGATAQAPRIKKFRMEENAADRIEGEMAYDMKLVSSDCGIFFDTCVA
jgi:hypothetical protein